MNFYVNFQSWELKIVDFNLFCHFFKFFEFFQGENNSELVDFCLNLLQKLYFFINLLKRSIYFNKISLK